MPDTCPHDQEWLKYFHASGNVQCMNCGHVWVSRARVKRAVEQRKLNAMRELGQIMAHDVPEAAGQTGRQS